MHFDPYQVEVIVEEKVSTQQKLLTGLVTLYFLVGASAIGLVLFLSLKQS